MTSIDITDVINHVHIVVPLFFILSICSLVFLIWTIILDQNMDDAVVLTAPIFLCFIIAAICLGIFAPDFIKAELSSKFLRTDYELSNDTQISDVIIDSCYNNKPTVGSISVIPYDDTDIKIIAYQISKADNRYIMYLYDEKNEVKKEIAEKTTVDVAGSTISDTGENETVPNIVKTVISSIFGFAVLCIIGFLGIISFCKAKKMLKELLEEEMK